MKAYVYSVLALAFLAVAYAVECPAEDGDDVTILANPSDCSTFYKCDQGVPAILSCPDGLHFNVELKVCDWPESANCTAEEADVVDENNDDEADESNNEEDSESEEEEEDENQENRKPKKGGKKDNDRWIGIIRRCPKVNGKYAVSIPNLRDCRKFFKCDHGKAIPFSCPTGLLYNSKLQVCDWPKNVTCRSFVKSTDVVDGQ